MERGNETSVTKFILLGFTRDPKKKILFFALFLGLYMITLMGNIGMILVIRLSPHLHTPMYYFISNLSIIDFLLSSVIVPSTLWNFLSVEAVVSLLACAAQIYGFVALVCAECSLLSLMAFDRYNAICHPLHYIVVMRKENCFKLVAISYIISLLYSMTHTIPTMRLPFCGNNAIQHFVCEIPALLKIACVDTQPNYILLFTVGGLFSVFFFSTICVSYIYILSTILKFHSAGSRRKAFSTCGSHLLTVTLFYVTGSLMYFRPQSSSAPAHEGVVSVFYTVVSPMLNPIIYSVRNKDVKDALKAIASPKCSMTH